MRRMKAIVSLLVTALLILQTVVPVCAAEQSEPIVSMEADAEAQIESESDEKQSCEILPDWYEENIDVVMKETVAEENTEIEAGEESGQDALSEDAELIDDSDLLSAQFKNIIRPEVHTKEEIRNYYEKHPFSLIESDTFSVMPSVTEERAGRLSKASKENALNSLNFVRYVAGIDADVEWSDSYEEKVAAGAVLLEKIGGLEHKPSQPPDMSSAFYKLGYQGTSSSNISGGYKNCADALITGFMNDGDPSNLDRAGHRRWCLNPKMGKTAFGVSGNYRCMYAFDSSKNPAKDYDYVAWPAALQPIEYFSGPFTVSLNTGKYKTMDINNVSVAVKVNGNTYTLDKNDNIESLSREYFNVNTDGMGIPNCVIFRPEYTFKSGDKAEITIRGLEDKQGNPGELTYSVEFFTLKKGYTIVWRNYDSSILEIDEEVEAGTIPTYNGKTPERKEDERYRYVFKTWSPTVSKAKADTNYFAMFTAIDKHAKYTVTWKNWDGSILETDEDVAEGSMPEYNGNTPKRPDDSRYTYTFKAWSPTLSAVRGNVTYTATFTSAAKPTEKKYTVTWKNWDGSILETDKNVAEGSMPVYNGNTPKRLEDSRYTYVFKGWNPSLKKVTGKAIYTAEFAAAKKGTVTGGGDTSQSGSSGSSGGGSSSGGSGGGGSAGGPGAKSTTVTGAPTFSKNWVADAAGVWRIRDKAGNYVTSAWLCDDAVTSNGQNVWYLMNTDGTMLAAGLVQDNTGNYYSLEMNHNGYYGMLRYTNGTYDGIYMEFSQKHDGTFGAITNQSAIDALKAKCGVTKFGIGNDRCVYTKSFE